MISDYYYIYILAIEPEVARKGYGTLIMNEVIQLAEKEKKEIILDTFNKKNLKFYKKFGFQQDANQMIDKLSEEENLEGFSIRRSLSKN